MITIEKLIALIEEKKNRLETDELMAEVVTIEENAPVALMQVAIEHEVSALRWVLKQIEGGEP